MKKTSKTKIATTYATAIYDAVKNHDKILLEINELLCVVKTDKELVDFITNPTIDFAIKKQVIDKLKISAELKGAINAIIENNRGAELEVILSEFVKIYYQKNNTSMVDVVSTYKLKATELNKISTKLQKRLSKEVVINNIVDPNILGGLVVKYDSQMIDSSVLGRLNTIQKIMKGEGL